MLFKQTYLLFCLLIFSFCSLSYAQSPTNDLLFAVVNGNLEGIHTALQNGADPSAKMRELFYDLNYYTTNNSIPSQLRDSANRDEIALHYTIRYFHDRTDITLIEALINAGTDVNAINTDEQTPMDILLTRKHSVSHLTLDVLLVIDNSFTMGVTPSEPLLSNDIEERLPQIIEGASNFKRDNAHLENIPLPNPMGTEILEQLYPQSTFDFIIEVEKILLAHNALTKFDIDQSNWFHH